MSHYAVLVMSEHGGEDVPELLARYSENIEVEPYVKYTREQAIEHDRKYSLDCLISWVKKQEKNKDEDYSKWIDLCSEHLLRSDEECYQSVKEDYNDLVDDDGNILSTYNPDSKWDWWAYGGRWGDRLKRNNEEYCDEGYAADMDFRQNKKSYKEHLKWWEENIDTGEPDGFLSADYYKDYYKDKETFAKIMSLPIFRSVVTPDGEWHEKGEMGWFAMSSETPEESLDWDLNFMERFIKPAVENNWYLTVVDCHI